jgi:hypothetical protein
LLTFNGQHGVISQEIPLGEPQTLQKKINLAGTSSASKKKRLNWPSEIAKIIGET